MDDYYDDFDCTEQCEENEDIDGYYNDIGDSILYFYDLDEGKVLPPGDLPF